MHTHIFPLYSVCLHCLHKPFWRTHVAHVLLNAAVPKRPDTAVCPVQHCPPRGGFLCPVLADQFTGRHRRDSSSGATFSRQQTLSRVDICRLAPPAAAIDTTPGREQPPFLAGLSACVACFHAKSSARFFLAFCLCFKTPIYTGARA